MYIYVAIVHILCSCIYCEKPGLLGKGENDALVDPDGGGNENDEAASEIPGETDMDELGYTVADDEE